MMPSSTQSTVPDFADLVARAEKLAPALADRSARCEQLRSVPTETVADFVANGLLRLCQPRRYGGYELAWDAVCEITQALARGCGSQAWIQNIFNSHAQIVGTFPTEAQDEVWGQESDAHIAASFDPVGTARPTSGGVVYSGRHAFSSGIDHARWLICGGHLRSDKTDPIRSFFLLPKDEVRIVDDWFVIGLAGTGSKSFEVSEIFVPEHRILPFADADAGLGPGSRINTAPLYRLPPTVMTTGFAASGIGIAEGFLASYLEYTRPRKTRGTPVAASMGAQIGVGAASARIDAAAGLYLASARRIMHVLAEGGALSTRDRLRNRRDSAFACQLALDAVTRLFNAAGGRALRSGNALERRFRDLIGVASHHAIVWDSVAADYGRHLLGNP
jgi:3-hydroxy-9,10-secoandrosta-1,3,5(10)-triene-9,17-dione monooxygenase